MSTSFPIGDVPARSAAGHRNLTGARRARPARRVGKGRGSAEAAISCKYGRLVRRLRLMALRRLARVSCAVFLVLGACALRPAARVARAGEAPEPVAASPTQ